MAALLLNTRRLRTARTQAFRTRDFIRKTIKEGTRDFENGNPTEVEVKEWSRSLQMMVDSMPLSFAFANLPYIGKYAYVREKPYWAEVFATIFDPTNYYHKDFFIEAIPYLPIQFLVEILREHEDAIVGTLCIVETVKKLHEYILYVRDREYLTPEFLEANADIPWLSKCAMTAELATCLQTGPIIKCLEPIKMADGSLRQFYLGYTPGIGFVECLRQSWSWKQCIYWSQFTTDGRYSLTIRDIMNNAMTEHPFPWDWPTVRNRADFTHGIISIQSD